MVQIVAGRDALSAPHGEPNGLAGIRRGGFGNSSRPLPPPVNGVLDHGVVQRRLGINWAKGLLIGGGRSGDVLDSVATADWTSSSCLRTDTSN